MQVCCGSPYVTCLPHPRCIGCNRRWMARPDLHEGATVSQARDEQRTCSCSRSFRCCHRWTQCVPSVQQSNKYMLTLSQRRSEHTARRTPSQRRPMLAAIVGPSLRAPSITSTGVPCFLANTCSLPETASRWICIRIDASGAIFSTGLAAYLVYGSSFNASNTGFSLNMAGMCGNIEASNAADKWFSRIQWHDSLVGPYPQRIRGSG